jgi:predicted transcriptional regulator
MNSNRRSRGSLEHDVRSILAVSGAPMTPARVRAELGGDLAYTTVLTVLVRLHAKGELARVPAGRGHAYRLVADAAELTARRMFRLLDAEPAARASVLARFVGQLRSGDEHLLRTLLDAPPEGARADETGGGAC